MAADQGTGSTITFATSAFSADLLSVNGSGASREAVETTHMGTSTAHTFVPADIPDNGEISIEIAFVGNLDIASDLLAAAAETITIDWAGTGIGYKWAFTGFCTGFDVTGEINSRMTANVTLKISGDITVA